MAAVGQASKFFPFPDWGSVLCGIIPGASGSGVQVDGTLEHGTD